MPALHRFLTRRWLLALFGIAAVLFGVAMLHPYPRQSLFGPKIDGVPWCVWESEIRRAATPGRSHPWLLRLVEKMGLLKRPNVRDNRTLLPVYLHLANDDDIDVRRFSLWSLNRIDEGWRWSEEEEAEILPIVRQHLQDDDPACRMACAQYIWNASRAPEMIKIPLAYIDHPDPFIQRCARITLCYLAEGDLDASFDPVVKLASDTKMKLDVRTTAVQTLRHFGKRGVPKLREAMSDPDSDVRWSALLAISWLPKGAEAFIPDLLAMQRDPEPVFRRRAAAMLTKIDANRFPAPAIPAKEQ
jgi:hypothetical protein